MFENANKEEVEISITNTIDDDIVSNLPDVNNIYWSSMTQPANEEFIFWIINGEDNFCLNCTYLIKLKFIA